METSDKDYTKNLTSKIHEEIDEKMRRRHSPSGRVFGGIIVVGIGAVLLAKQTGVIFPEWFFSWGMILIVIGVYIGARHSFRSGAWFIPVIIGSALMIDDYNPDLKFHQYIWPIIIIAVGLVMILRPRRKKNDWASWNSPIAGSLKNISDTDDFIDSVSVFGGNKKNIISKDFKGGDIVIFFGGMELNLMQADLTGPVELEITEFFGGTKLIVPNNWRIKSELVTVFGSFEDKRQLVQGFPENEKLLILKGTCVFGGIDVKNYVRS